MCGPGTIPTRILLGDRNLWSTFRPCLPAAMGDRHAGGWHTDLQGPLIQWAVLALDPVTGSSLQIRVKGTSKDGVIFLQALWRWVLGTRENLQIQGQLWGPHIQDNLLIISRH